MIRAFDKVNFLAYNDTLEEIVDALDHIGIKVEGGYKRDE
jgi:hypothetical protein